MSAIDGVFIGINAACNLYNLVDSGKKLFPSSPDSDKAPIELRASHFATQVISSACSLYEIDLECTHAPAITLLNVKRVECVDKFISIFIRGGVEGYRCDGTTKGIVKAIERGFIAPIADFGRVVAEDCVYDAQHYLEMSDEEFAKQQVAVYRPTRGPSPGFEFDHYRPMTREECKKELSDGQSADIVFSSIRATAEIKTATKTVELYSKLADFLRSHPAPAANRPQAPVAHLAPNPIQNQEEPIPDAPDPVHIIDPFDLLRGDSIPGHLCDIDPFFSENICDISLLPIRDPVRDPTGPHMYDRIWILRALRRERKSPITRLPLQPSQLIPMPGLKAQIDARLRHHQETLRSHAFPLPVAPIEEQPVLNVEAEVV